MDISTILLQSNQVGIEIWLPDAIETLKYWFKQATVFARMVMGLWIVVNLALFFYVGTWKTFLGFMFALAQTFIINGLEAGILDGLNYYETLKWICLINLFLLFFIFIYFGFNEGIANISDFFNIAKDLLIHYIAYFITFVVFNETYSTPFDLSNYFTLNRFWQSLCPLCCN